MTKEQAMIHTLAKENDELKAEIGRLRQALEQQTSDDCVSRKRIKQIVSNITAEYDTETIHIDRLMDEIDDMPSVTPTQNKCKDCTNYVVGALDEEICIRGHELIYKDFYCADYKKRGSENEVN